MSEPDGRAAHSLEVLRDLLARDGVLWSTPAHPIRHRNGATAPWMFYSWNVSMTGDGLRLAADALLSRLSGFAATQLATHGMTGLPLLSACIARGAGRYTGLAIRHERKDYLSGRRIEGPGDPTQPVVVVDDSLSSGTALFDAIEALEGDGYRVEGAVALVGFPGRGGRERAAQLGYRVEVLFDVDTDLGLPLHRYPLQLPAPPEDPNARAAEGLHPCQLARHTAEHWLARGTRPVEPVELDADYGGAGGVFVSFRRRGDDARLARDGLWHLPGDDQPYVSPAADVVDATIRTLRLAAVPIRPAQLADLKIAVTFLGRSDAVAPRELDYRRYAIVCTDHTGARRGGALPNTQVFSNEVQQYRHALTTNARITPTEPHRLYRQTVCKAVEAGASWPSYGQADGAELAWASDDSVGAQLADVAVRAMTPSDADAPIAPPSDPASGFCGAAVTLYRQATIGVGVAWGTTGLAALVGRAARDAQSRAGGVEPAATVLTVLFDEERFGTDQRLATMKVRPGLDAVRADGPAGTVHVALPGAAVYNGWSKPEFVAAVTRGAPRPLRTYRCAAWVRQHGQTHVLEQGFPARPPVTAAPDPTAQARALAQFTLRHLSADHVPLYALDAVSGARDRGGTAPRLLHALCGLHRAGKLLGEPAWCAAANRGFDTYLRGRAGPREFHVDRGGPLADAVLFAGRSGTAAAAPDPEFARVGRRLVAMVHDTGAIGSSPPSMTGHQDMIYLPGAVLAALATDPVLMQEVPEAVWRRTLAGQRARFDALQSWGMVGWSAQGWCAIHAVSADPDQAAFVFTLADWAVDRQVAVTGAFLEDLSPDEPSFNTGFIAEGIAAALALATRVGDTARADRYRHSWQLANAFLRRLQVDAEDTFVCADPAAALGGVRLVPSSPWIRADSVSHWLGALCTGLAVPGGLVSAGG